jgi:hypothetical protein
MPDPHELIGSGFDIDHVFGSKPLRDRCGVPAAIGRNDIPFIGVGIENANERAGEY